MANHPNRNTAAKQAKSAGYYIRRGSYMGTTDDRLDRWYVGHDGDNFFRPWGSGYRTQREAWEAAAEMSREAA